MKASELIKILTDATAGGVDPDVRIYDSSWGTDSDLDKDGWTSMRSPSSCWIVLGRSS